jgi:hypothetical protein
VINKDFEQVFAVTTVDQQTMLRISKYELQKKTKRELAHWIANFIIEHMSELPATYKVEKENTHFQGAEEHTLHLNLISDEEIKRLRHIEHMYNTHIFNPQSR